jgi:hypothetical protein
MTQSRTIKKLQWLIFGLVTMNIISIALLWLGQYRAPFPKPGTKESIEAGVQFLKDELDLNQTQIEQFVQARKSHMTAMLPLQNEIHIHKKEILEETFKQKTDTTFILSQSKLIGDLISKLKSSWLIICWNCSLIAIPCKNSDSRD